MFKCLDNLEKYLNNNMNVLLVGKHGIGKTAIVKELFTRKFGNKWKYFSAAVMDPFLDFVGVPEKRIDSITNKAYLDLVRPKCFEDDDVEAIFMDEYNRAPKKILAATMELIQFKEINGKKFNNLKVVWAAINPDDLREYDVEKLDPAIQDRFQIQINLPYLLDKDYFTNKFGKEIGGAAIEWWHDQDEKTKDSVSPRRLEYALDVYKIQGDLKDVLPKNCNAGKLHESLKLGSLGTRVEKLLKETDAQKIKDALDINIKSYIKKNLTRKDYIEKFTEFLDEEIIVQEAPSNYEMCQFIDKNRQKFDISLLTTLDQKDCFKESAFKDVFAAINKLFPEGKYTAKYRNRIKKILEIIPDVNKIKVRQGDIPNIQRLNNLVGSYLCAARRASIIRNDNNYKFLEKFSNLEEYNKVKQLGLDFYSGEAFALGTWINDYNRLNPKPKAQNPSKGKPIQRTTVFGTDINGNTVEIDENGNIVGTI